MSLRCPVCRAENVAGAACRRCRADLSLLAAVEARREYHLSVALRAIQEGRLDEALEELNRAQELRDGADIRRRRACVFLLAGDYPAALIEHLAARA